MSKPSKQDVLELIAIRLVLSRFPDSDIVDEAINRVAENNEPLATRLRHVQTVLPL